jgi:hypothetical protein
VEYDQPYDLNQRIYKINHCCNDEDDLFLTKNRKKIVSYFHETAKIRKTSMYRPFSSFSISCEMLFYHFDSSPQHLNCA